MRLMPQQHNCFVMPIAAEMKGPRLLAGNLSGQLDFVLHVTG